MSPKITVHGGPSNADVPPLIVAAPTEPRDQTLDDPYHSWSRKDLVAEARKRDLPSYGTKDELVARLKANESGWEE